MKDIFKKMASLVVEVDNDAPPLPPPSAGPPPTGLRKTLVDLVQDDPASETSLPIAAPPPISRPSAPQAGPPPTPTVSLPSPDPAAGGEAPAPAASGSVFGPDGQIDVKAIYLKHNVPASPFTAEQAFDMIQGLPADLPRMVKQQTVKVMISSMGKAMGVTPETVVLDANSKIEALKTFIEGTTKQSETYTALLEMEIQALEGKIRDARNNIQIAQDRVRALSEGCSREQERLQEMADFFSTGPLPA